MTDLDALARRAVACKGWRWHPGMLAICLNDGTAYRLIGTDEQPRLSDGTLLPNAAEWTVPGSLAVRYVPDLFDPATLGCLLALVREACGDPSLYVRLSDTTRQSDGVRAWEVLGWLDPSRSQDGRGGSWRGWGYASDGEALIAALEAMP
jgi:hypothetical protein